MKKIMTIIGARPQIIKAAAISRALETLYAHEIEELIVHTGQHYDENMSAVFFEELGIPKPFAQLSIGSSSHGDQTGAMMRELESLMVKHSPDAVIVYGDTNSTLAGSLAASKIHIPVVHIEAGLRSFNKAMPEEINRIMTDHVSTLLFSPTKQGISNLQREGFSMNLDGNATIDSPKTWHCGDIMYDNSLHFSKVAEQKSTLLEQIGCKGKPFILATVHRNTNTDDPQRLQAIFRGLVTIARAHQLDLVLPLHPRTRKYLQQIADPAFLEQLSAASGIHLIDPVGFLDMIALEQQASLVVTDSGGVQKEAYFFRKPCIVLREETEWVELIETGAAVLTGADEAKLIAAANRFLAQPPSTFPEIFGDGSASAFICKTISEELFQ
ncbi:MAG TPA: UDP-N-acetylglucosamine 2-epimerase (non-hydrolyzing) [Fluviicola sp.]|nr:UDP-N-acetylglucosamine 2-epimerase (non-hydrolyzing) [Fluviicola sp.]